MKLAISGIIDDSVVDGPGVRYVIFTQGCPHHCKGCHNPETHPFDGGTEITTEDILEDLKNHRYIKGITFSGGEPMAQPEAVAEVAKALKEKGYHLVSFSGYTYEQIMEDPKKAEVLNHIDVLIDGPFIMDRKSLALKFRGSANQRTIDIKKTQETGTIVTLEWD